MMKALEAKLLERVRLDPRVLTGKPVIAGTRIAVDFQVRFGGFDVSESADEKLFGLDRVLCVLLQEPSLDQLAKEMIIERHRGLLEYGFLVA